MQPFYVLNDYIKMTEDRLKKIQAKHFHLMPGSCCSLCCLGSGDTGDSGCPQFPVPQRNICRVLPRHMHSKSARLAPAAGGRHVEAEAERERDGQIQRPGGAEHRGRLSEVIFFPWSSFLAIFLSAPPPF